MDLNGNVIYAVDFDGTLSFGRFPGVGDPNDNLFRFLKAEQERGLFPAKAADLVKFQLVQVHIDHPGAEEEDQLDQRMADHMQERSVHGQAVMFPRLGKQDRHADPCQDKANLGNRGAGQRPL